MLLTALCSLDRICACGAEMFMTDYTEDFSQNIEIFVSFYVYISKPEEVVDEFHSFCTLYSDSAMELNTDPILPFLIASKMDQAYPHLTILHRIYKNIPISSASAE